MNKVVSKLDKLSKNIEELSLKLQKLNAEYDELRLVSLRNVEIVRPKKADGTITLKSGDRIIKAKKNRYGRYVVKEGARILVDEYMYGIHDLRFAISIGKV